MKKIIATATFAVIVLAGNISMAKQANACNAGISCKQPTGVGHGQKAPVWKVAYCVIGNPGSFTKVDCKSSMAVHLAPTGNMAVCFIGTDGKAHWDYQYAVYVGARFINRNVGGHWQPDWRHY